ncbi:MAG: YihY family inner membrane protein [Chlamydiia bacterium]|nr:YihY family inner membrane protein [Chlamydiia bacterium]
MYQKISRYFREGLWNSSLYQETGWRCFVLKALRTGVLATQQFFHNRCSLHAASLTYYTVMAVVPILTVSFAIGRVFGFHDALKAEIVKQFDQNQEIVITLLGFADAMVDQVKGGSLALLGLFVLLWSIEQLLSSLERSLNQLWEVKRHRSWRRVLSDYLAITLFGPCFFFLATGAAVFFVDKVGEGLRALGLQAVIFTAIFFVVKLIPYCLFWVLFTFIYLFMPNTKVRPSSALLGGVCGGSAYMAMQLIYIHFQTLFNGYGVVYGSFAALPLFLIWVQVSWILLLFGACISQAHQTLQRHHFAEPSMEVSSYHKRFISRERSNSQDRARRHPAFELGSADDTVRTDFSVASGGIYPMRFEPVYKSYVWGGERIAKRFSRARLPLPCAESWEIADRSEGISIVANGIFQGKSLHELMVEWGADFLGGGASLSEFPLLIKIIDAKENLSIQVHPDDRAASLLHGEPKTESWVFLSDGAVYAGLKPGTTPEALRYAVESGVAEKFLEKLVLRAGDVIHVPAGCVHALCAGCFVLEIQQNSNTTYRLYDWGRAGRELHVDQALASIHWHSDTTPTQTPLLIEKDLHHTLESLTQCPYFKIDRWQIFDQWNVPVNPNTFQIFFFTQGEGRIIVNGQAEPFKPGMTYLVPACACQIGIQGACQAIRIWRP